MAKKRSKAKAKPASAAESPMTLANTSSVVDSINTDAIAAALSSVAQPVLLKVCRLCETKDGPFLNIFDPETLTAKKTQELMPFVIAEYDDLPHKICFRCSAKVEELHEFVQKCIKTQERLRKALGRCGPKTQSSKLWEEKLHKSNISNDDICDALIKKAMAGIEDLPLNTFDGGKPLQNNNQTPNIDEKVEEDDDDESDLPLNQVNRETDKYTRTRREANNRSDNNIVAKNPALHSLINKKIAIPQSLINKAAIEMPSANDEQSTSHIKNGNKKAKMPNQHKSNVKTEKCLSKPNVLSNEEDDSDTNIKIKQPEQINQEVAKTEVSMKDKNFDIMDHVSMIKVNGVGVLFQCKLCNRNFLKKEVVVSHGCAKTGVPKFDFTKNLAPVLDPPKVTTVKYINTRMDKPAIVTTTISPPAITNPKPTQLPQPEVKPKPKVGPASKVKRIMVGIDTIPQDPSSALATDVRPSPAATMPAVEFPAAPNLKSRYKLVPGPNNTFTLMEDVDRSFPSTQLMQNTTGPTESRPKVTPKILSDVPQQIVKTALSRQSQSQIIDLDDSEEITPNVSVTTPYPVGLFSTVPHTSNIISAPVVSQPVPFTTPAMKKQSYTIVKTGNPSKLLISAKPQPPVEEPPKKKARKSKTTPNIDDNATPPVNASSDDSARGKDQFFTFINVDPLLQPSYVLPTDNIIQESQISTSTPQNNATSADANVYSCNMCSEKFSREKKLLTHIQSHYSKMDEEDQVREKNIKRRGRTSNAK